MAKALNTGKDAQGLHKSAFAEEKKKFMKIINETRATGVATDVDLPSIVVIGDQSSGKSSLIEAISGVNLPRAQGTCTRVPTEVRLRHEPTQTWSCVVKIRRETDSAEQEHTSKPERFFGLALDNPDQVCTRVRQAQLCILYQNAGIADERFLEFNGEDKKAFPSTHTPLRFSKDVVVLEISGPQLTDLTLVDLPGLIHYSDQKDDVPFVEELVKSYISKDCLILLVIQTKSDVNTQKAVLLAQDADADRKRTIGILTKVDSLVGVEVDPWLDVLRSGKSTQGEKTSFKHGFYITRQPTADELEEGITFEEARSRERALFAKKAPWCDLSLDLQRRLGTNNLTKVLSDQLSLSIKQRLPELRKEIIKKIAETEQEIADLGEEPSPDAARQLHDMVQKFTASLSAYTDGGPRHEQLMRMINEKYLDFKASMWYTAPRFCPFTDAELNSLVFGRMNVKPKRRFTAAKMRQIEITQTDMDIDIKDEHDQDIFVGLPDGGFDKTIYESSKDTGIESGVKDIEEFNDAELGRGGAMADVMALDDVLDEIKRSVTRELPDEVPPRVKAQIIKFYMSDWKGIAEDLVNDITPLLENVSRKLIDHEFGKFTQGSLREDVEEIVNTQIQVLHMTARQHISQLSRMEDRHFTMNNQYLTETGMKVLAKLRKERRERLSTHKPDPAIHAQKVVDACTALKAVGIDVSSEDDLGSFEKSPYENGLKVMAEVRAYWQVAYKRVIGIYPMAIDQNLISPLGEAIKEQLIKGLGVFAVGADDRCRAYLAEDPNIVQMRQELKRKLKRLQDARSAVRGFQ